MSGDGYEPAHLAGTQTIEPDAAFARLGGTYSNLRAGDLPAFARARGLSEQLIALIDLIHRHVSVRATLRVFAELSLAISFGLFIYTLSCVLQDAVAGYDFVADLAGRSRLYRLLTLTATISLGISVSFRLVLWVASTRLRIIIIRRLSDAGEALRGIRGSRVVGIGHSLSRVAIGEAGLSIRSNTRQLKLHWGTFDAKETRLKTPKLPEVPEILRMPVSLATLDACQSHASWRAFSDAVENWAANHSCLVLRLHRNLDAETQFLPVREPVSPQPLPRRSNRYKQRFVKADYEPWEEILPIHQRFFEGEDSNISWPQFVFFALALMHSKAQPPEGLREGPLDLRAGL